MELYYEYHNFEIIAHPDDDYPSTKYYEYKIYGFACLPYDDGIIISDECYDTLLEAEHAARKHIDSLVNGGE